MKMIFALCIFAYTQTTHVALFDMLLLVSFSTQAMAEHGEDYVTNNETVQLMKKRMEFDPCQV